MNKSIVFVVTFIIWILLFACKTSEVYMEILVPPEVEIPPDIKSFVPVNRALAGHYRKTMDTLEGSLSGETIYSDSLGSLAFLRGIMDTLGDSLNLQILKKEIILIESLGAGSSDSLLDWEIAETICAKYNAEALLVLEAFDTNIRIDKGIYSESICRANMELEVFSSWRIYDALNRRIIDDKSMQEYVIWEKESDCIDSAVNKLPNKNYATIQAGYLTGITYAKRITPVWSEVNRRFYARGNDFFKKAGQLVAKGKWSDAAALWKHCINQDDKKTSGYACYNMALACEVDGRLDLALHWLEMAKKKYKNRTASGYMKIIIKRINDQEKLKRHIGN